MKNLHTKRVISLPVGLLSIVIVLFTACQSKPKTNTNTRVKPKAKVEKEEKRVPKMDIHTAAFMGSLEAMKQHIAMGSDLNIIEPLGGATPLISAITFDKTDVARVLIEGGADLNLQNYEGSTALHVAAFFCRTEIVKLLIENKANKAIKNKYGSTAYESVLAPFDAMKPIYVQISRDLAPLGFELDLAKLESTRPVIANLLK